MNNEAIVAILKENKMRPSFIRVRIYTLLVESRIHPTVDEIYEQLSKEILTLSKTTVYNTLKLFIDKGIVRAINIEGNELRFEAARGFHGHFKCRICGKIYDIPMGEDAITKELEGFMINDIQVLVSGVCPDCE